MQLICLTLCSLGIIIYVFVIVLTPLVSESISDGDGRVQLGTIDALTHMFLLDGTLMKGTVIDVTSLSCHGLGVMADVCAQGCFETVGL